MAQKKQKTRRLPRSVVLALRRRELRIYRKGSN